MGISQHKLSTQKIFWLTTLIIFAYVFVRIRFLLENIRYLEVCLCGFNSIILHVLNFSYFVKVDIFLQPQF